MAKKYSLQQVKEMLLSGGYVLDDDCDYIDDRTGLVFSDSDGYFYSSSFKDFLYSLQVDRPINPFFHSNIFKAENVSKYLSGFGFTFLDDEYKDVHKKMNVADCQGYKYYVNLDALNSSIRRNDNDLPSLRRFDKRNIHTLHNIGLWLLKNDLRITLVGGEYKSARLRTLEVACNDCGHTWMAVWNDLQCGRGCVECYLSKDKKRLDLDFVESVFNDNGFYFIDDDLEYAGCFEKFAVRDVDGYLYHLTHNSVGRGHTPLKFHIANPFSTENVRKWIIENECEFEMVGGEYAGAQERTLELLCSKCGNQFKSHWISISAGNGCPYCASVKICYENSLGAKRPDLVDEWDYDKNSLTPYEIAPRSEKVIWWICPNGHSYSAIPCNRNHNNPTNASGCPQCQKSKGENEVKRFLNQNNIEYASQMEFPKMPRIRRRLSFDFYLPDFNLCIEYNGHQHYRPVNFGGISDKKAQKKYDAQIHRDQIKRDFCNKNNIKLIEIPYWNFDNIEEILERELGGY